MTEEVKAPNWKSTKAREAIHDTAELIANHYCSEDDTFYGEVARLSKEIARVVDSDANPVDVEVKRVYGWIKGTGNNLRGYWDGSTGKSGEKWYVDEHGNGWSQWDVDFKPDPSCEWNAPADVEVRAGE